MTAQGNLFGGTGSYGESLARRDDPITSHEAAAAIVSSVAELQAWAVACVRETPGLTQAELGAAHCPADLRKIGRRLRECERKGLLRNGANRRCKKTGRTAQTWYPVEVQP